MVNYFSLSVVNGFVWYQLCIPQGNKNIDDIPLSSVLDTEEAVAGTSSEASGTSALKDFESDEDLELLTDMIQTSQFHHPHHRAFQVRKITYQPHLSP